MFKSKFVIVLKGGKTEKHRVGEFAKKFSEYAIFASNVYPSNKTAKYYINRIKNFTQQIRLRRACKANDEAMVVRNLW